MEEDRYNVLLLLDLQNENPCVLEASKMKNTSKRFIKFIKNCVNSNNIRTNEIIILDNASVHNSKKVKMNLQPWLNQKGIVLGSLPTYSPELNPCGLIFF